MSFVLNEVIVPQTNSAHERIFQELKNEPPPSAKPFLVVDANDEVTNSVIYVQKGFDQSTQTMRDVWVVQYWNNRPAVFVYGREAAWKAGTEWSFKDGYQKIIGEKGIGSGQTITMSFRESRTVKIGKTPDQLALFQKKHDELSFFQLRDYIRMLQSQGADVNEYRVRLYEKISLPLTSLVFALIGTPLGLRPHRSSSAMGLGLAIVIIFAYWVFMHYMTILGNNGAVSPAAASFIPTLAGACLGIALIARAAK